MQSAAKTSAATKMTRTRRTPGTPISRRRSPTECARMMTTSAPSQINHSTPAFPRFGGGAGARSIGKGGRFDSTAELYAIYAVEFPREDRKNKPETRNQKPES